MNHTFGIYACTKHGRDGTKCVNRTDHADGWCRAKGCEGFVRAKAATTRFAPSDRVIHSKSKEEPSGIQDHSQPVPQQGPLQVSLTASDLYKAHHGGSSVEAVGALQMIAEWCLSATAGTVLTEKWDRHVYGSDGFAISLNSRSGRVVSYSAVHQDRTWAQVRAGITSRVSKKRLPTVRWIDDADNPESTHVTFLASLTVGAPHQGTVVDVTTIGLLIRVGNAIGLLHTSHFDDVGSWAVVKDLSVGTEVEVIIDAVDVSELRLSLRPGRDWPEKPNVIA